MSAAEFYHKVDALFNKHLKLHCNLDFNVHFRGNKATVQKMWIFDQNVDF